MIPQPLYKAINGRSEQFSLSVRSRMIPRFLPGMSKSGMGKFPETQIVIWFHSHYIRPLTEDLSSFPFHFVTHDPSLSSRNVKILHGKIPRDTNRKPQPRTFHQPGPSPCIRHTAAGGKSSQYEDVKAKTETAPVQVRPSLVVRLRCMVPVPVHCGHSRLLHASLWFEFHEAQARRVAGFSLRFHYQRHLHFATAQGHLLRPVFRAHFQKAAGRGGWRHQRRTCSGRGVAAAEPRTETRRSPQTANGVQPARPGKRGVMLFQLSVQLVLQ